MIRAATFDDLPALVELSRAYHAEMHGQLPFDEGYVAESFRARTLDTVEGMCFCLEDNNGIAGYLAATVSMLFSAPVRIGVELAWFVRPECRGRGGSLIEEYEDWAKWKGCIGCSLSMNEFPADLARTRAMVRFIERRGYHAYERGFLKRF